MNFFMVSLFALPSRKIIRRAKKRGAAYSFLFMHPDGDQLAEIGDLLGPAQAHSTNDIVQAAQAKLGAINKQIGELALLRCRLRRLVQVCEHGDGDDCVALRLEQLDVNEKGR